RMDSILYFMVPQHPLKGTWMSRSLFWRYFTPLPSFVISVTSFQKGLSRGILMKAGFLPDRGVVKVSGEDARNFLNGLVTTDVTLLQPGLGRFGALLTPQGKITADFLITEAPAGHGSGFLIDAPRALAQNLADRLSFYKLRAKVTVENI